MLRVRVTYGRTEDFLTDVEQQVARGGLLVRIDAPNATLGAPVHLEIVTPCNTAVIPATVLQPLPGLGVAVKVDPEAFVGLAESARRQPSTTGAPPKHEHLPPDAAPPRPPSGSRTAITLPPVSASGSRTGIVPPATGSRTGIVPPPVESGSRPGIVPPPVERTRGTTPPERHPTTLPAEARRSTTDLPPIVEVTRRPTTDRASTRPPTDRASSPPPDRQKRSSTDPPNRPLDPLGETIRPPGTRKITELPLFEPIKRPTDPPPAPELPRTTSKAALPGAIETVRQKPATSRPRAGTERDIVETVRSVSVNETLHPPISQPLPKPQLAVGSDPEIATADEPERDADESDDQKPNQAQLNAQKIQLALHGDKNQRAAILREPNKMLHGYILRNPGLQLDEVIGIARMNTASIELLTAIANRREGAGRAEVALALVRNPKTPVPLAIKMLDHVGAGELRTLAKQQSVRDAIQRAARKKILG